MKIAFVSQPVDWLLPPHQNSIGIWTYQIARRLARTHQVTVYAKRTRDQHTAANEGMTFRFIRSLPNRLWDRPRRWLPTGNRRRPFFASTLFQAEYALQVALDIRRTRADIVHIQNAPHFAPIIRALNPRAKIVLHMHCEWLTQLDTALMRRRIETADLVIGCSSYITSKIQRRFPELSGRCHTVFNGVDIDCFHPRGRENEGAKHLLFVGRVSPEKGIHHLLDAFEQVRWHYPDLRLSIVGPIESVPQALIVDLSDEPLVRQLAHYYQRPYLETLREQIPAAAAHQVSFTGSLAHAEVADYYRRADVLVNPSLSESFGMSLVEAMASSVPVVAARTGGMSDIVADGQTGLLVKPGNSAKLADAILTLLDDQQASEEMGRNGQRRAEACFSWESIVSQLTHHYQHL